MSAASHRKRANSSPPSSAKKVRAYRERMRKRGMKLIQIWVPNPNSPEFKKEARRQMKLLARSPHAKNDQDFVDAISWWPNGDKA